jgi:hypothetical protein
MLKRAEKMPFWRTGLLCLGCLVALVLMMAALAGPLQTLPAMDEAYIMVSARNLADGMLPYRDFYDYLTPGSQLLGALYIRLNGFSVVGLRLLVILGWVLEIILVCDMAKNRLSKGGLALLAAFLCLTDARYPVYQHHFWSGLTATVAVYLTWRHLKDVYAGRASWLFLAGSGVFCALTCWIPQSLGVLLTLGLGCFGLLHVLFQEREERGVGFRKLSTIQVLQRWLRDWGPRWALPMLSVHAAGVLVLLSLGLWEAFVRDAILWTAGGNYQKITVIGYFTTFHQEFMQTVAPLLAQLPMPYLALFLFRIPIAVHLFLIGVLPVVGLLGAGYQLPGRFMYRLLRLQDEELLLWWLAGSAMVLSTFSYSTSMHIVSNGAVIYLLAAVMLQAWLSRRPRLRRLFPVLATVGLLLVLVGMVIGSAMPLLLAPRLPVFPGMPERLLYTDTAAGAEEFAGVSRFLQEAHEQGRSVFVFYETPSLYLTGQFRNATRFTLVIPKAVTPAQASEILRDLDAHRPLYVVDDQAPLTLRHDHRFAQYQPEELAIPGLDQYISRHYRLQATLGKYKIFRRLD